jgi:hypothetical protein
MNRRLVIGTGAALLVLCNCLIATFSADAAGPRGAACQLKGSATIRPGLTQTATTQSITLSGVTLTGCRSGSAASPNTSTLTGTVTTSPNPVSVKASCASGNLTLTATIAWSNGQQTATSITTKGVTANQAIKGTVTSSTNPALATGDTVAGDVAFKPTTTGQNCVKVPVTAVTFQGALVSGSPK